MAINQMVAYDPKKHKASKKLQKEIKKINEKEMKQMRAGTYTMPENSAINKFRKNVATALGTRKTEVYSPDATVAAYTLKNNTTNAANNTPAQDAYNEYLNSLASGGSGGGGTITPQRVDLTDILASYEQGAAAQRKTIEDSRESQRQSLLTSLKRFQDETAEARRQQRRSYNASRADLEGQAFMSNRQVAQSAAARGLGGSGLQQLAQLQNQINQGQATDKLAQSNTDVLKQLATAAQSKEEDTNTALQNLDTESANKIAAIEANNAQARANLQYQEAVRYEEARQQAEALAAQLSASNASSANSYRLAALENAANQEANLNEGRSALTIALQNGLEAIKDARETTTTKDKTKSEGIRQAKTEANAALRAAAVKYNIPISEISTYTDQINDYFNSVYNNKHKYK